MQQLDSVRMPELMGREPAPHPSLDREVAQLRADGGGTTTRDRELDHQSRRTAAPAAVRCDPSTSWPSGPCPRVHPDLATAVALPMPDQQTAAGSLRSVSASESASWIRTPRARAPRSGLASAGHDDYLRPGA